MCNIIKNIRADRLTGKVVLIHHGFAKPIVNDLVQGSTVGIPILIRRFKRSVLTTIIQYFLDPVKRIVQIFYFVAVSVVQFAQFAVVGVVNVLGKGAVARLDLVGVAKRIVGEAVGSQSRLYGADAIGGVVGVRDRKRLGAK